MQATVMAWKVYGADGHRQRLSFGDSFSFAHDNISCAVFNSDITGTNEYTILNVIASSIEECRKELVAQLCDGVFEDSKYGKIEEIYNGGIK